MPKELPTHAQVVVIGGGVVGCSTAYHLAKYGVKDVVLLERKFLTCGTTWAAAGLMINLRGTLELAKMTAYGMKLYQEIEKETEQPTGYVNTGSLLIATNMERQLEYERFLSICETLDVEIRRIGLDELKELWPLISTEDILSAYYMPNDAVVNPVDTAMSMSIGARRNGARIFEETEVLDFDLKNGVVRGVRTNRGDVKCECVVLCTGMWSRDLARKTGVSVPLHATEHMHFTTQPIEGTYKGMPILRDQDGFLYFREEVGGLLVGAFELKAKPYGTDGLPPDWQFRELPDDMEHLEPLLKNALKRVPALETTDIRHFTTTAESFTPDNLYIMGEAPGLKKFYTACGMNSSGVLCGAGVGKKMAEWITQGYPSSGDIWELDIRRCFPWQMNRNYLRDRAVEEPGNTWANHWPYKQWETARPVRKSALHDRLAARGACFGQLAGWERANWFAPAGVEPQYRYSWLRQNWFDYSAAEHLAVRHGVGMYDLSSMANFVLQGRDALAVLQKVCANDVATPIGKVVYTQMLNERGGIEADLTVTRLAEDQFFIVTAGATAGRDFDWISRHIPEYAHAFLTDMTSAYTMLGIMGPKSRELLAKVTKADLSNQAFPFATAQEIELAYATPLAVRMSYVGELGWELYLPPDFATGVFDALIEAGEELGLKLVGLHAVDSLRLERGFRHWPSDIGPDYTPFEAGLGFAVKLDKGGFIGREALLEQKKEGLKRRLAIFTLEDSEPLLYHLEPIYRNGQRVSYVTHGAYGHLLGRALGMGYLENPAGVSDEWILEGRYEIGWQGKRYPAQVHLRAPYDPQGERTRM
ncbi:MAG: FAD-dependent oxidoreductase [Thermodesulfobacteriota bacterium]